MTEFLVLVNEVDKKKFLFHIYSDFCGQDLLLFAALQQPISRLLRESTLFPRGQALPELSSDTANFE